MPSTDSSSKPTAASGQAAGNPLEGGGDHDRVVMLSLKADGTPDQHNPEVIGDKESAVAAARRQFAEQAVAAVDANRRAELGLAGTAGAGEPSPDTQIDKLKSEHDAAAKTAEGRAESLVNSLHKG